eukprot:TRINITY_DN8977_c0_g1_i1.p1 TRINITY_DN8977_c0_g1~~TRINITY_DN8977_c0_g1_i1.p1  ORF type:complete len:204 (-),score=56.77 TRINITY_DN8977_c0_g1_i1:64-636(-)
MKFLVVIALFVAFAFAASPSPPVWPAEFSASVLISSNDRRRPEFTRWFASYTQKLDRFDGLTEWKGEEYLAEIIIDGKTQQQTNVFYDRESVVCFKHANNRTFPQPNFSNFEYRGLALIDYNVVLHWGERVRGDIFLEYFETQVGRNPVQFNVHDLRRERVDTWRFWEFDAAAQDPSVFTLPQAIQAVCN